MNEYIKDKFRWIRSAKETIPLLVNSDNPVLIYQMGKVGSTSILDSLTGNWSGPILHSHHLDFPQARYIYNQQYSRNKPIHIISLTREPISRNISAYFQNLDYFSKGNIDLSSANIDSIVENFLQFYPHDMPLTWFQNHFETHFDLNVFEQPFPENGVAVFAKENLRVLLMRAEIADRLKEESVANFLNIPDFKLTRANVGENKEYAEIYKEFKSTLKLPQSYIEKMYTSQYFKHFYAGQIGDKLSLRWRNQLAEKRS